MYELRIFDVPVWLQEILWQVVETEKLSKGYRDFQRRWRRTDVRSPNKRQKEGFADSERGGPECERRRRDERNTQTDSRSRRNMGLLK